MTELLNTNNIDFTIRGQADLAEQNEVKSILILLWYITRRVDKSYISSADELKELNLKGFCSEFFNQSFKSLDESTKQYLNDLQEKYHENLLKVENEFRKSQGKRNVKAVHNIKKNEDEETLLNIFAQVEKPVIDLEKIQNIDDKEFFTNLETLREEIQDNEKTTLDIYYELLSMSDYFIDFENNISEINNLAMLSQTMQNFESFISNTDIKGVYFFLSRIIKNYDKFYQNNGGVQLMTVHAAKGLEFPVVIVANLEEDKFPMEVKDPEREKRYINRSETFYTPNEFLEFKDVTVDEENRLDAEEEERIVYVAMTRAADLLILSCLDEIPESILKIKHLLKELDLSNVTIKKHFNQEDDDKLKLNYSSYSTYNLCPFMYNLIYNLGFRLSSENVTNLGTVFHEVMEVVNLKLKEGEEISKEELENITREVYESMFDIKESDDKYIEIQESVLNYFETYSLDVDVLEAELPFEIERENYILNGAIDLIYRISDNEIGILDYKNAEHDDFKIKHYEKQLYIYASALKELSEFKDFEIKKGITHFVKTDYKNEIDLTDEKITKQLVKLDEVALKIKDEVFPKRKTRFCENCKFRIIC